MGSITNKEILDGIIIGRVEPHIYAFSTQTVPNYLKVGDTYRPVEIRLDEWRKHFPNLEKQFSEASKVGDDAYFRDFAIHHFLENEKHRARLLPETLPELPYYSKEFFKDATEEDLLQAIADINNEYDNNGSKYQFYKFDENRLPITHTYARVAEYEPRPNQEATIKKFNEARAKGQTNLLMYAVMRFGKSFTSMCCAVEMKAKLVVVVSAKADVQQEWKKTVESHIKFENYVFFNSGNLLSSETILTEQLKTKNIVVFLTLQDLQGDDIKKKHKEIFGTNIDLLIIDETHFGARASEFSKAIRSYDKTEYNKQKQEFEQTDKDFEDFGTEVKALQSKVRLHLSGTPYRILMGSEFTPDDIIGFYQFTDIVTDQEAWDDEYLCKDDVKEWDNPYYGFPQMVRFAFNPNESSIKKMEEMRKNNISCAFTALFKPKSRTKDTKNNNHKQFEHEQEILELLEVIDGSKNDDNLLGFLDYDKIKEGKMCRHIVCVVPYKASCDALECLIKNNSEKFKNLNEYEIINIAGVNDERTYNTIETVKAKIKKCEQDGKKTITLTVNRMLTGTTVEEWDTMLYLKDTQSPQEYDQAIFRIQNQHIKTYIDSNGDEIKYNMKPQTLLVDFDPCRLFRMQEQKSQIYNANTENNGNDKLEDRMKLELAISPVIVLNQNQIRKVEATDILTLISDYSNDKSVADEATVIPIDYSLLDDTEIRAEIEKQAEMSSKGGFETKAVKGDGDDIVTPENPATADGEQPVNQPSTKPTPQTKEEIDAIRKKFATYYSRILFFSFLTNSTVKNLNEIIASIDGNDDNERIADHLEIKMNILDLFRTKMNPFVLSKLDYKIQNLNLLDNDTSLPPIDRATNALRKFGRMSESEVVTPANIANDMVAMLPEDEITENTKILDIAAKQGEFAVALYRKFSEKIKNNIYSIPTSAVAYEFTRKVYEMLDMPIDNIYSDFNSYDIIAEGNEQIIKKLEDMKFDVIVGNPPYQIKDGGASASAKPIYNNFVNVAKTIEPNYLAIIIPAKWYNGGKGLDDFRADMLNDERMKKLVDFTDSNDCFTGVDIAGGVCYFLWDNIYSGLCSVMSAKNGQTVIHERDLSEHETFIRDYSALTIIEKVRNLETVFFNSIVSSRKPFGLATNIKPTQTGDITLRYNGGKGLYNISDIEKKQEWVDKWKVITSYLTYDHAGRADKEGKRRIISTLEILKPQEICTETYIVINAFDTENEAQNQLGYIKTKFARFLIMQLTSTQHITKNNYALVPLQDFNEEWTDEKLYAKYKLTDAEIAFIESMIKPMN